MARASYIYAVLEADSRVWPLVAAFTVKHELCSWYERHEHFGGGVDWHVVRVPDGRQADHNAFEGAPLIHDYWLENR